MSVPQYSTEIADAWAVVERMRADWFSFKGWQPSKDRHDHAVVSFICGAGPCPRHGNPHQNHHGAYDVEAETFPLAIARAALVALKIEGVVCAPCEEGNHACHEGACACCGRGSGP